VSLFGRHERQQLASLREINQALEERVAATDRQFGALSRRFAQLERDVNARSFSHDAVRQPYWDEGRGRFSTGPNGDIIPSLAVLRNRARHVYQNDAHARSAVNARVRGIVGTGLVPRFGRMVRGEFISDERLDALFAEWGRVCYVGSDLDFWGLCDLIERTRTLSGEVLVRARARSLTDGYPVPLQLEVLECDQLDDTRDGITSTSGGQSVAGVEFDAIGRRSGYWILRQHPAETFSFTLGQGQESVLVPYSRVAHYYLSDRPGQVRGVPDLAAILEAIQYLGDLQLAKMLKLRAESSIVAAATAESRDALFGDPADTTDLAGESVEVDNVGVASVIKLRQGEELTFAQQTASPDYVAILQDQQRRLAAGMGLTFEKLTGNLSTVNYSSYRAGVVDFEESCRAHRENVLIPMCLDRIVQWFVEAAGMAGKIAEPSVVEWQWSRPIRKLDKDDADIYTSLLERGLASEIGIISDMGGDWRRIVREREEFARATRPLATDP
jgi:lambda family phage portal protein